MTKSKILAILAGGLFAGILSGIPIIGFLWLIWAILGGIIAVGLYFLIAGPPVSAMDGLVLGGGAGLIGGIANVAVDAIIIVAFAAVGAFSGNSADPAATFLVNVSFSAVGLIISAVISFIILMIAASSGVIMSIMLGSGHKPQPADLFGRPGTAARPGNAANPFDQQPGHKPGSNPFDTPR